jgi:uncharacterized linocin/CFP29 family protein
MDDRNAQVGWTEAQWNRVREEVLRAWQQVRVAGSFLPAYGPLPRSTQRVPSEVLKADGTVDDQATAAVLEISLPVTLNRQQVMEEDLSTALLEFRRRATQVGQLEDWYIFNGQYPRGGPQASDNVVKKYIESQTDLLQKEGNEAAEPFRPDVSYLDPKKWTFLGGVEKPMAGVAPLRQKKRLLERNPGALGLIEGATKVDDPDDPEQGDMRLKRVGPMGFKLTNEGLKEAIVRAITTLDDHGYVAPHVCVFALGPFLAANSPLSTNTNAVPRDRLEPLIGREILHASAIDRRPAGVSAEEVPDWQNRGLVLSLAGDPVDIAIVTEATTEFRQVDEKGSYIFAVFERFALRIKDSNAIVALAFEEP